MVVSHILILELRKVEVARPAHPPANRIAVLPALIARRTRIGPTQLPLLPCLREVLGIRPQAVSHQLGAHAPAHLCQPLLHGLLRNRRLQLIVLLRRHQPTPLQFQIVVDVDVVVVVDLHGVVL